MAAALFAAALLTVVAALIASATSRHSYRRAHLGITGGLGLVGLDVLMLGAVLTSVPMPAWPVLIPVVASLARIGLTLRALPVPVAFVR